MKPFETVVSNMAPLNVPNVDTDQIIPKQFLKRVERTGFGQFLFYDWRYLDDGRPNPKFVLNKPEYSQAQILLAEDNFGCGSSREHAPWALQDYGFRVIIAPSFADIFYNNCFQNGVLPIVLPRSEVSQLFQVVESQPAGTFEVNLEAQHIRPVDGQDCSVIQFEITPELKEKLLKGLDDIGWTLQFGEHISDFEREHIIY